MKSAVITGATGAVGTALVKTLVEKNIDVLVITRKDSNRNDRIPDSQRVEVVYADLSELSHLTYHRNDYDVFFHLAWAGTSGAGRNDIYLQNENIRYALDAVCLAKWLGCSTYIGAGSQAEYGNSCNKLTPDTPTNPFTGYGFAKLCAGQMTRQLAHQKGMKHIWTRILSVYGPNDGENSMISMLIGNLRKGIPVNLTACTQMWDYLYSYDAAKALYALGLKGVDGKIYVLGSGNVRPLKDYVEEVRAQVVHDAEINYGAIPFSENQVRYLCADIDAIRKDTGWCPQTNFSEGIKSTIEWYQNTH